MSGKKRQRSRSTAALSTAACSAVLILGQALPAGADFDELAGRWSGWGSVKMHSGATEQVKCVATFFPASNGVTVRQNLRCASANYKIDVTASMQAKGSTITGTWEERTHSNSGQITGTAAGSNYNLSVSGQAFSAGIRMKSSPCKLSINIVPRNVDIARIAIGLSKC